MAARRTGIAVVAAVAALLAGALLQPAAAAPIKWLAVQLGSHRFSRLLAPAAIVARAGPKEVGFEQAGRCGCFDPPGGPTSFDIARDGSVWLFDVLNHRLLAWEPGRPSRPQRSLRLPQGLDVREFALGPDRTIYLYAVYADPPPGDSHDDLWALTPAGRVRWRAPAKIGNALRLGPDGALYTIGAYANDRSAWTPLTSPTGRPLSPAQQHRRTSALEPLAGGLRLFAIQLSAHEIHLALIDRAQKVVRAWRVTSHTALELARGVLTPALVGRDLVLALDVSRQVRNRFLREHLVLRLGAASGTRRRFALDARAIWHDEGAGSSSPLRLGPGGLLYQLRTNPKTGVSIAAYSLGRA